MGRRNKTYSKDLHQQAYDRLTVQRDDEGAQAGNGHRHGEE